MRYLYRIVIFTLILVWCTGIMAEFLIPSSGLFAIVYPFANLCYSHVCHQLPQKTIVFGQSHLLVCSRCAGIYAGVLLSSFLSLFVFDYINKKLKLMYLYLAALPMLTDVIFYSIHMYSYSKIIAFITGILLGSVGFFYILEAFENFILKSNSDI